MTDELYLDFSRTGNRRNWERVHGRLEGRLQALALAECLENKGHYLAEIETTIQHLCSRPSWVMPAHDRSLDTFYGRETIIDLGSSDLGWLMATIHYLLGDRLTDSTRKLIKENLNKRIFTPYEAMLAGKQKPMWWFTTTNNWNAVCLANVTGAALAMIPERGKRALYVAAAEHHIMSFLKGFTSDGYCSEGLGYWNYGYGHFLLLTEMVRRATGGNVDFLELPGAKPPASFGVNIQITPGIAPAFADCSIHAKPSPFSLYYLSRRLDESWIAKDEQPDFSRGSLPDGLLFVTLPMDSARSDTDRFVLPERTWFNQAGVLICRPGKTGSCRLGAALKGGHNAEHHNHNDVGSYVVVVDDTLLLADPGAEIYTARTFSNRRYESKAINSYGHPVPVIAGQLQRTGREAQAKILQTKFSDEEDTLVLDITPAYDVPDLKSLTRTFVYSRKKSGSLTITDTVTFSELQSFATALITFGKIEQHGPEELVIREGKKAVSVLIRSTSGKWTISEETIDEDFKDRQKPTRIGIELAEPVREATVTLRITPTND